MDDIASLQIYCTLLVCHTCNICNLLHILQVHCTLHECRMFPHCYLINNDSSVCSDEGCVKIEDNIDEKGLKSIFVLSKLDRIYPNKVLTTLARSTRCWTQVGYLLKILGYYVVYSLWQNHLVQNIITGVSYEFS